MRTRTLRRRNRTETITFEPFTGVDGQGAPSYGSSVSTTAQVRKTTEFLRRADGSDIVVSLVLRVPGDETNIPGRRDRVTYGGATYIVETEDEVKQLGGEVDHYKFMLRDEG